jgi:hypothetical protein
MNRQQILEREGRWARTAGIAAVAVAPLYIASVAIDQSSSVPTAGIDTERYRAIDAQAGELFASVLLRGIAFALMVVPLLYLFRAAQARSERVSGPMVGFVFLGPLLFGIQGIVAWIAQTAVASDFVAQAAAGGDLYTLLDDLSEDSVVFAVAANLLFPAILGLLVAMVYVPLQAMRVGLLTRFFATFGMALGVATLFIIPAISLLALVLWVAWLGLLILNRTPKGRPPAWDTGEAIPWPRPGDEPATATATGEGVVETDATEVFPEPEPRDNTARRERAKKRKRKRRR